VNYDPSALSPSVVVNPPASKPTQVGGTDPSFEHEFAMVREEAGISDPGSQNCIASTIGINGYVHDVIISMGTKTYNTSPSGIFTGRCTVTGYPADLLCTYEIALYSNNQADPSKQYRNDGTYGVGAFIAHGPVFGQYSTAIVTGAHFDFSKYHTGSLELEQVPSSPVLYASLKLYE
jgi:hypothetical protein